MRVATKRSNTQTRTSEAASSGSRAARTRVESDVAGVGEAWVGARLGLGEAARQFGVGLHGGDIETRLGVVGKPEAGVGEEALVALFRVLPKALLRLIGEGAERIHVSIHPADWASTPAERANVSSTVDARPRRKRAASIVSVPLGVRASSVRAASIVGTVRGRAIGGDAQWRELHRLLGAGG